MRFTLEELAATDLLRDLPLATLREIATHGDALTLAAGDCLLSPHADNHHIHLLLAGTLSVHFVSTDTLPIRSVRAGLSVGELSVIDGNPPSAWVLASEPCRVFRIHRDLVNRLIGDACPLARNLLAILAHWVKTNTVRMVEHQTQIDTLTHHAHLDDLTGLYNRRWLETVVDDLIELGQPLTALMLDVDHFKRYNDSLGHPAGDRALRALADALRATVRPSDCLVRYGGEEFLVLLPCTDHTEGRCIAERIRLAIAGSEVRDAEGEPLPGITTSIGLATGAAGLTLDALVHTADAALYRAKAAGRNCVRG